MRAKSEKRTNREMSARIGKEHPGRQCMTAIQQPRVGGERLGMAPWSPDQITPELKIAPVPDIAARGGQHKLAICRCQRKIAIYVVSARF